MYDDAHVNVLEPNIGAKEWGEKKNPKCKSYNFMDSTKFVQVLF
jgi:hypothetical protein